MSWHPTLDSLERKVEPHQRPGGSMTEGLPIMGRLGGCWCGEPHGHDWPGKADGEPHPR